MNVAATTCAGLGLFFVGMRLIAGHLRDLASGGIRQVIARAINHPTRASFAGFAAGALTQSTSAVTFIAAGLLSARTLSLTVAVSLLAWANAGTALLVLIASFDSHSITLYLLGLLGLGFFSGLDQHERFRHITYAVFGLALILFGLILVKSAVAEVRGDIWVIEFVEFSTSSIGIALLSGYVLAIGLQSSSVVAALALPLVSEGLIDLHGLSYLILGACAGSGTAVVLVSSGMEGPARQLALTQGIVRGGASLALLPIMLAEQSGLMPGLVALTESITQRPSTQVGTLFLAVQLTGVFLAWVFRSQILALAARGAPESHEESLSKPVYLYDNAAADAQTALELLRLEHVRLARALPDFLEDLRSREERNPDAPPLKVRAEASAAVAARMSEFLSAIQRSNPDIAHEQIYDERRRLADLIELQKTLAQFVTQMAEIDERERPPFVQPLVEGLHALLGVVSEICSDGDEDSRAILMELTSERSDLIDRARRELLSGASTSASKELALNSVLLLERILWMLRERSPLPSASPLLSNASFGSAPT